MQSCCAEERQTARKQASYTDLTYEIQTRIDNKRARNWWRHRRVTQCTVNHTRNTGALCIIIYGPNVTLISGGPGADIVKLNSLHR